MGYRLAGFEERLAVEWNNNAAETYALNFPGVPIYCGDIAKLCASEALQMAGLEKGQLDTLDGSPPCQGFSTAGRRRYNDPRNSLFQEFARLLNDMQPRTFVMENVTGMVKGHMKQAYLVIMKTLRDCGYRCVGQIMNAKWFNVPQSRERVIIIGVRDDLGLEPSHPKPKNRVVTAAQALDGVKNDPEELKWLLECGGKYASYKHWWLMKEGQSQFAITGRSGFTNFKQSATKPFQTVTKFNANIGAAGLMHWGERRRFSVAEFKRACSFPDDFVFAGGYSDAVSCLGNSVPPNFMRAIAEHIKSEMLLI